jgi:hypothetical protein
MELVCSLLIALMFVAIAISLVLVPYFVTRKLVGFNADTDKTYDAASAVAFRIAALHGLILALVYAQELNDFQSIRTVLTEEAVAVADLFYDAGRYGGPESQPIRRDLANYTALVVNQEWDLLGRGAGLSPEASKQWNDAYLRLLDLNPVSKRQNFLADRMLRRVTDLARFRQLRLSTATDGFSYIFWAPALIGTMLVAVPFFVFPPTRANLLLLCLFGTYAGIILFFIFAFDNPFSVPGRLAPEPFQYLLRHEMGNFLNKTT